MKKSNLWLILPVLIFVFVACNEKESKVVIGTDMGLMKAKLYDDTPLHKENFLKLVNDNFYDSLLFHRVIQGFMIQGGDPESRSAQPGQLLGQGGPGYNIPAEIRHIHIRGALAAARMGDNVNPQKESSGSQFYIIDGRPVTDALLDNMENQKNIRYTDRQRELYKEYGGSPQLDGDYTVFGRVTEGLEVIDKIAEVPKDENDRPIQDIQMYITKE